MLLLKKGADPNATDIYNVAPLSTAAGTGGDRSIDLLIEYGAAINHQDIDATTALHACFFRGNIECFKRLMKYKPDASLRQKNGLLPLECASRDNMHHILDYVLNDEEARHEVHLSATSANIERLLQLSIMQQADDCTRVLLSYQEKHRAEVHLDRASLFAKTLTIYNFTRNKDDSAQQLNIGILEQIMKCELDSEPRLAQQCEKVLLAIAASNYGDHKLAAIFERALIVLVQDSKKVPCFLLKFCLMFGK